MAPLKRAEHQPISTEIRLADGIFMKTMVVPDAGTIVPQHAHSFDHLSVLIRGRVMVYRDDDPRGELFVAPDSILIKAAVKHLFQTLAPDTAILCVHDIGAAEGVSIEAEHHLEGLQ